MYEAFLPQIRENLEPLEIMAALVGAVAHDLDHPGVNQPFLIATSNHLAALYENTSVLENHHWRSAIGCLLESGVAEQVQQYRPELEQQISSLILATDITRQQEFIQRFKNYLDTGSLDMRNAPDRHFILQISLKCADISNPCRPWDVSKKWSQKVCEEFFRQGDYERQLGLPVTTLCDRHTTSMSKIQVGFFKFVVTPLFDEWHRFLDTPLSRQMMRNLRVNQRKWEALIVQETAEETRTEISEAEVIDVDTELEIDTSPQPPTKATTQHRLSLRSMTDNQQIRLEQERRSSHPQQLLQVHTQTQEQEDYEEDAEVDDRGSEENLLPELPTLKLSPTIRVQADGRRYSVPISIVTQPPASTSSLSAGGKRRESLPAEHIVPRSVADWDSSLSLLTSTSSAESHVGGLSASGPSERPLSAENLLPEPSIASMTSVNADRLSSVLQHGPLDRSGASGGGSRHLIRQQTFPPLQPGAASTRARYMSTAADLSGGRERYVLPEASSRSSTSSESLKAPGLVPLSTAPHQSSGISTSQRSSTGSCRQKENVDPMLLVGAGSRYRSLNRRRGSAPAPTLPSADESLNLTTVQKHGEILRSVHRRGSVPAAIIKLRSFEVDPNLYVDPEWSTPPNRSAPTSGASSDCGAVSLSISSNYKRRGSVPCETPAKVRADDLSTPDSGVRAPPLRPNGANNQQPPTSASSSHNHHRQKSTSQRTSNTSPEQENVAQTAGGFLAAPPAAGAGRRKGSVNTILGDSSNGSGGSSQQQQQRRRGSLPADVVTLGYTGSFRR
ncbi:uncharacterized protein LOC113377781 [Ctenocephalides felis]|uniref:uncharacterized protein LOC113377781 n=1 Tax=Ctenocephalides felis TaxID=7515 RepID=UPI000E6E5897|nr:uncharacterized protein LOC113377781 [Ctenocephalides felis]